MSRVAENRNDEDHSVDSWDKHSTSFPVGCRPRCATLSRLKLKFIFSWWTLCTS